MLTITDYTIAAATTTQKLAGTTERSSAAMVGVQNKDAAVTLYVKCGTANSSADSTTDSIEVGPGEYLELGPAISAANVYDIDKIYVYSTLLGHEYAVKKVVA